MSPLSAGPPKRKRGWPGFFLDRGGPAPKLDKNDPALKQIVEELKRGRDPDWFTAIVNERLGRDNPGRAAS